jgi:hypothetical protein
MKPKPAFAPGLVDQRYELIIFQLGHPLAR